MTQVIIPPSVSDPDLLFDEAEAREILAFFWPQPHFASQIGSMTTTNEVRRFAQSLLIAAVDASYAMGYVEILFTTVANPRWGLKKLSQKLARRFVSYWWKHTKPQDLENIRIYKSVRRTVSYNFAGPFRLVPFYLVAGCPGQAWA